MVFKKEYLNTTVVVKFTTVVVPEYSYLFNNSVFAVEL